VVDETEKNRFPGFAFLPAPPIPHFMKFFALFIFSAITILAQATAQQSNASFPLMSIEQALDQRDETRMSLQGVFLRQHRGEEDEFIFQDLAGDEILVYDRNAVREVVFNTAVIIEGSIDRGNILRREFNLQRVIPVDAVSSASVTVKPSATSPMSPLPSKQDGVFIHMSSGPSKPHAALMALTMAANFAGEKPVLLYADLEAIALLSKDADALSAPGYLSSADRIPELLKAGVLIRVCPTCLAAQGLSSDDLIEGVELANKNEFFSFTSGRILTFDY